MTPSAKYDIVYIGLIYISQQYNTEYIRKTMHFKIVLIQEKGVKFDLYVIRFNPTGSRPPLVGQLKVPMIKIME